MIFVRSRQAFQAKPWAGEPLGGTLTRARRTGAALATLVAVALIGAGCSSTGSTSKIAPQTPTNRGVNQINPVDYSKLTQGGTLNLPVEGTIVQFNLDEVDGPNLDTQTLDSTLLPSLFTTDAANNFYVDTDYLTGDPKVSTSGDMTITYELNPKAKWSSGSPVSAADFIAEWNANNGTNKAFNVASTTGYDQIASVVQGKDQFEVVVTFKPGVTYADWKGLFSPLFPAAMDASPDAFNTSWKNKPLDSAGPFMFSAQDAQSYTVVKNPNWWGRKPALDTIIFHVISPDAEIQALQNHEVDAVDIGPAAAEYQQAKTFPGVDIRVAGGPQFRHITINGSSPQLQDPNVRQGLAMGIDRTAIATAMLTPLGVTPAALNNHIFMSNQAGYQDNSGDVGKYDPTAAGAKLDQAGYTVDPATGMRAKDGKPLVINFVIPSQVATSAQEAQLVQSQLAQIKVKVNIKVVDVNHFFDQYITPGLFDFTVFTWVGTPFPVSSSQSIYASVQGGNWQQNYSRISDPNLDALFKTAESELDPKKELDDGNAIDALIWKDVYSLTMYQRPDLWAAKSTLANYGAFGFASVDWTDVGFTAAS
jgi:peptide/nickel transport system substrate-binding protein